jgi:hypothetical protein
MKLFQVLGLAQPVQKLLSLLILLLTIGKKLLCKDKDLQTAFALLYTNKKVVIYQVLKHSF